MSEAFCILDPGLVGSSVRMLVSTSSWSIPDPPQYMQSLSLLRNFANPECHFTKFATLSNPKIMIQFRVGIVSVRTPESQRFCIFVLKIIPRVTPKISQPQGPGPARPGPHSPNVARGVQDQL